MYFLRCRIHVADNYRGIAPTRPLGSNGSKLPNADVLSLFRQTTCSGVLLYTIILSNNPATVTVIVGKLKKRRCSSSFFKRPKLGLVIALYHCKKLKVVLTCVLEPLDSFLMSKKQQHRSGMTFDFELPGL